VSEQIQTIDVEIRSSRNFMTADPRYHVREAHRRDTGTVRHPPDRLPARRPSSIVPWAEEKTHDGLHRDLTLGMRRIPPRRVNIHAYAHSGTGRSVRGVNSIVQEKRIGPGPPRRGGASQHTQHREAIPRPAPGPRMYGHLRTTLTHTRTPAPEGPCVVSSQTCSTKLTGSAGD